MSLNFIISRELIIWYYDIFVLIWLFDVFSILDILFRVFVVVFLFLSFILSIIMCFSFSFFENLYSLIMDNISFLNFCWNWFEDNCQWCQRLWSYIQWSRMEENMISEEWKFPPEFDQLIHQLIEFSYLGNIFNWYSVNTLFTLINPILCDFLLFFCIQIQSLTRFSIKVF